MEVSLMTYHIQIGLYNLRRGTHCPISKICLVCSYLTGRKQRVVIKGDLSNWCDVASGVPQGSILGPLLFLMYVNDMVEELSKSTNIALFADDAKTYSKIESNNDHQALQRDLSKLEDWSNLWKVKFNSNKCKVLHMSWSATLCIEWMMKSWKM